MVPRYIEPEVLSALERQSAVALLGPRQAGKTTLALVIGRQRDATYLDLEDSNHRSRLAEPALFLEGIEDRLVILDEIHRLPELFQALRGIRLVKSPKVYIRDSGLVHALLGIGTLTALAGHPVVGLSWEGFVIESLLSVLPWGCSASFYRTSAGAEIDLLIEHPDGECWAVEIKRSLAATVSRGFHVACRDIDARRAFLVHAGDDRFPISATLEGIGLRELVAELDSRS